MNQSDQVLDEMLRELNSAKGARPKLPGLSGRTVRQIAGERRRRNRIRQRAVAAVVVVAVLIGGSMLVIRVGQRHEAPDVATEFRPRTAAERQASTADRNSRERVGLAKLPLAEIQKRYAQLECECELVGAERAWAAAQRTIEYSKLFPDAIGNIGRQNRWAQRFLLAVKNSDDETRTQRLQALIAIFPGTSAAETAKKMLVLN